VRRNVLRAALRRLVPGGLVLVLVASVATCSRGAATGPASSSPPAPRSKPTPAAPSPVRSAPRPPPLTIEDEYLERACRVQPFVEDAAKAHDVAPNLLNALIWLESKFDPRAHNRSGARGLMQLMPKTSQAMAKALGRPNRPYDPEFSVHAGAHLLSLLLRKFDGDERLALFGYARGSGSVRAWQAKKQPLPEGVRTFIEKVERGRETFSLLGFPHAAACGKS